MPGNDGQSPTQRIFDPEFGNQVLGCFEERRKNFLGYVREGVGNIFRCSLVFDGVYFYDFVWLGDPDFPKFDFGVSLNSVQ